MGLYLYIKETTKYIRKKFIERLENIGKIQKIT